MTLPPNIFDLVIIKILNYFDRKFIFEVTIFISIYFLS